MRLDIFLERLCEARGAYTFTPALLATIDGAVVQVSGGYGSGIGFLHVCKRHSDSREYALYIKSPWSGVDCSCSQGGSPYSYWLADQDNDVATCSQRMRFRYVEISSIKDGANLIKPEAYLEKILPTIKPDKTEDIRARVLTSDEKEKFYELFQIGVEVEGEYHFDADSIDEKSHGYFSEGDDTIKYDGSVGRKHGGYCYELVTGIVTTPNEDKAFLKSLKLLERGGTFAKENRTAGTHIHLDFSDAFRASFRKKYGFAYSRDMLRIFDSLAFEKFFFKEYFKTFRLPKFWHRLQNDYCSSFLLAVDDKIVSDSWATVEHGKSDGARYRWLNYQCLADGEGIEFRIFPHIQTARGMALVVSFTQRVVMKYMAKMATKKNFGIIHDFYANASPVDVSKLSKERRVVYEALGMEGKVRYKGQGTRVSFDVMKFIHLISK